MLSLSNKRITLKTLLAVRFAEVSVGVTLLLFAFYFAKYIIDQPNLRRLTLATEANAIFTAVRNDQDPALLSQYKNFPNSYAFRVYEGRMLDRPRLVTQANGDLFKSFIPTGSGEVQTDPSIIARGMLFGEGPDNRPDLERSMLTEHEDIGQKSYWVQVVMVGDPAGRWWRVMGDEMLDHVIIPVLSIVPALGLALMLTAAIALQPLERTARQAAALGAAVGAGVELKPLSTENLPFEFYEVVTAINTMLNKLEHALDMQKQFTSDAAHELRTPLAVLLLQLDELPPGPNLDVIRKGIQALAALIEELLQFAQAENASKEQRQQTDVAAIAREVCEERAASAYNRGQVIEFQSSDRAIPILGHPVLIETAIRNVVDNALKYSPEGATISVNVETASQVVVCDQGPGIRAEHKELVFNRFWRANRRHADGAGIGLAMVRRIVELHEGTVGVEDRSGGGACIVLNFAPVGLPSAEGARACFAQAKSMGFDGIHGAFWIGNSTGIDSPLGGGRCRRPILLIFEVG